MKHVGFAGRLVMIGCGSIGQGVLPLLLRHIDLAPEQITILAADDDAARIAEGYGIRHEVMALTPANLRHTLGPRLGEGDFLLNLSVGVSSVALIQIARERGALYLDTCIEPWPGGYTDPALTPSQRSNYALRETALALRGPGPTAVVAHGANPGLVSYFVKQALLDIARDTGCGTEMPTTRDGWAGLAEQLGIRAIHIAERDTQRSPLPKQQGEFVNTWSIEGFVDEGRQPAELGWGTHETALPSDGRRHAFGCDAAIYLLRPGAGTRVRSWTPLAGPFHGFLITHNESIAIADYFTRRDDHGVRYRPTVHYAYHPCDDAVLSLHELAGQNWRLQARRRLLMEEISAGHDELGVLLMGHAKGAYWYGSRLSIEATRDLVPHNNATSLQVTVAVLAGMIWAIRNPGRGVVEADDIDMTPILEICRPYLGEVVGVYSDWTPLQDRGRLFDEDVDADDPWQFSNVRVV
jgi:homospermidine synthase